MAETSPDMNRPPVDTEPGITRPNPERLSREEGESFARRAAIEEQMAKSRAESEEEALRVSAGIKSKREKPLIRVVEPPSPGSEVMGGLGKLAVGWPLGPLPEKVIKQVGYGLSGLFTAIENAGHDALKKSEKFWKWIPGIGTWLGSKPEKSWKEQDEEAAKKKEAEAKKKEKEGKKIKDLTDKGISADVAKVLIEGTAPEAKDEPPKAEPPKEEKAA